MTELENRPVARTRNLIVGLALVAFGTAGLTALSLMRSATAGMMGRGMMGNGGMGGMMRREDMKNMMQSMMGDRLPPGIDPGDLPEPRSQGAQLLIRYCSQCHNLPGPGMHTAAQWPAVVERMDRRMQMMGGMMDVAAPSRADLHTLLAYLQRHAQKPLDPAQYPELNSPDGRAFRTTCTQCHALPDPKQHTAQEWPAVVARMKRNMSAMGKDIPDESTTKHIVGFLQRHADGRR